MTPETLTFVISQIANIMQLRWAQVVDTLRQAKQSQHQSLRSHFLFLSICNIFNMH